MAIWKFLSNRCSTRQFSHGRKLWTHGVDFAKRGFCVHSGSYVYRDIFIKSEWLSGVAKAAKQS